MKIAIDINVNTPTALTTRERQVLCNRVGEILKMMAARISNAGAADMDFDVEGLKVTMRVDEQSTRTAA